MGDRMKLFNSIDDFYNSNGGRLSGECDMGVWHWDDRGYFAIPQGMEPPSNMQSGSIGSESVYLYSATANDRVRVSVVAETGDVYACRLTRGTILLLGNVRMKDPERGMGRRRSPVYDHADFFIGEYAHSSSLGRPLSWFVERLALCDRYPLWIVDLDQDTLEPIREPKVLIFNEADGSREWFNCIYGEIETRADEVAKAAVERWHDRSDKSSN